jgi:hypothetical protein
MNTNKTKNEISYELVEHWLGTDAQLEEAIDILTDIANGNYSPSLLKEEILDIEDSYQDQLEYLKETNSTH